MAVATTPAVSVAVAVAPPAELSTAVGKAGLTRLKVTRRVPESAVSQLAGAAPEKILTTPVPPTLERAVIVLSPAMTAALEMTVLTAIAVAP